MTNEAQPSVQSSRNRVRCISGLSEVLEARPWPWHGKWGRSYATELLYCGVYTNSGELALNHTADGLVVAKGKGAGGGVEQEVEVSRCKLF